MEALCAWRAGGACKLVGFTSSDQVGLCSFHRDSHMLASMKLLQDLHFSKTKEQTKPKTNSEILSFLLGDRFLAVRALEGKWQKKQRVGWGIGVGRDGGLTI